MASENAMKLKMVLVTGFVGILMTLKPSFCQAQAEINPDHYEMTNGGPTPAVQKGYTQTRSAAIRHQKPTPSSQGALKSRAVHPKKSRNKVQAQS